MLCKVGLLDCLKREEPNNICRSRTFLKKRKTFPLSEKKKNYSKIKQYSIKYSIQKTIIIFNYVLLTHHILLNKKKGFFFLFCRLYVCQLVVVILLHSPTLQQYGFFVVFYISSTEEEKSVCNLFIYLFIFNIFNFVLFDNSRHQPIKKKKCFTFPTLQRKKLGLKSTLHENKNERVCIFLYVLFYYNNFICLKMKIEIGAWLRRQKLILFFFSLKNKKFIYYLMFFFFFNKMFVLIGREKNYMEKNVGKNKWKKMMGKVEKNNGKNEKIKKKFY
ncbi:hypothetical protein RFI_04486 [Reticulomyxa filosa]|uniref:Uncharacterized protein n=1 Tax=Reticulomyxa filosa TaxID=46433 RepID=X6P326_RETFI|nr:hypothetical protein RFI_04486 [Reticulomyxa filosa]|eukprot:ETO32631.1 hypothetical protein RFI_04486 [Reticulomyxa filosa]